MQEGGRREEGEGEKLNLCLCEQALDMAIVPRRASEGMIVVVGLRIRGLSRSSRRHLWSDADYDR